MLWLLGVIVLGAFVVAGYYQYYALGPMRFETALGLSFANVFNFLGFQKSYFAADFTQKLPPLLKFLGGLQTILGVVLLFFLALGLRTRFRLR